ncbi:fimbrial protein, partial [Escherichia coli]|uniref:fimbrial protein n=1 Tax=Escherichia coli TaxID=562 RepID=UPI00374CFBAA
ILRGVRQQQDEPGRFSICSRQAAVVPGAGKQVYTATRVRVTFDGIPGETPDKFSLTGQAEGINLQIMDNYGYPARAGKSIPPLILRGNEDGLDYSLRIVRNGYPLKAGDYYAALRFKLDYE